jgi:hypothetical protein
MNTGIRMHDYALVEQYIIEALRDAGERLYNQQNVIGR